MTYLREQKYSIPALLTGASAGALTATLTACKVDFVRATELALDLSEKERVWDRGLQGIWGDLIEDWLDELLPDNAAERCKNVTILITRLPTLQKERITGFRSKKDLIDCNLASVHIPWFLNGQWTADFRGRPTFDGSFLTTRRDYTSNLDAIFLQHTDDPALRDKNLIDAIRVVPRESIWGLLEDGMRYAATLDQSGGFDSLK